MKIKYTLFTTLALSGLIVSCGDNGKTDSTDNKPGANTTPVEKKHDDDHDDHDHDDHDHGEEVTLGSHEIEGIKVEAAQGHGAVEAGKEGHLVIKLPFSDDGETVVRAWIGSADKTLSSAGKGVYAASHDDYEIHTVAPSPLPAEAKWWVEIEKPDGTKAVGSIPLLKDIKK